MIIRNILIIWFLCLVTMAFSQESIGADDQTFIMHLKHQDGITLVTCHKGCTWKAKELQWDGVNHTVGLASNGLLLDWADRNPENLQSAFDFALKMEDGNLSLIKGRGTTWELLDIPCSENGCFQYFDNKGLLDWK